jgi:small subunit ribosomal protein S8
LVKGVKEKKMANIVTTDPIADMLTRIRNAIKARHESVLVPMSNIKTEISKVLKNEGYIADYEIVSDGNGKMLKLTFKLENGKQKVIQGLRRISRPGLRVYSDVRDLPKVLSGLGIAIISTSYGIMTDKTAREKNLGGEVLAWVW